MAEIDDYWRLLVYAGVRGYGSAEDDPECADWISALRRQADSDGLLLEVGFHFDMATREYPVVRLARRDGRSFGSVREVPDWPFPVEREWGQTLEAARRRARVGRFTPPPPQQLRDDLSTLYEKGILLPYGEEDWWRRHWEELMDVSEPTGCLVIGRLLTDAVWHEELVRTGKSSTVESLAFLSVADPAGGRIDMDDAGLDRRDLTAAREYMRSVLERDYGPERLAWLRSWARGETCNDREA
jgi:hypothetical protein